MRDEIIDQTRRQINANALALRGIAAFSMFQVSFGNDLSRERRAELTRAWFKGAGSTVIEGIDELEAYAETPDAKEVDTDTPQGFLVNTGMLSLREINRLIGEGVFAKIVADMGGPSMVMAILRHLLMADDAHAEPLRMHDVQKFQEILRIVEED